MQPSTDDDLDTPPLDIITCHDLQDPTVLDHSIDLENDIYHPTMDSNIDEEDFTSFDECMSVSRSYLHHNDYDPDYICNVYHNECITCSGCDHNTADNSYYFSPQCMIKDQDYVALCLYLLWLPIDHMKHTPLLQPSGFTTYIVFHFANILSHVSLPPTSHLSPPT